MPAGIYCKNENKLYQKGNKIIVIDSTSEQHLADIFSSGLKFDGSVLFSGSAGLANNFPNIYDKNEDLKINIENSKSPVIVIAGSRNSIMEDQINYLKDRVNFAELKIDLEQIFSNKDGILDNYSTKCIEAVKANRDLVIHTNAIYNEEKLINEWSTMSGVNITVGLPIIRTSVDHGVAFGKAGEGRANEESMIEAIKMAIDFTRKK